MTAVDATAAVREAEVRALALLDGELPDVLDRLVRVAAQVTGASGARINIITTHDQHTIASAVGPAPAVPVEASMCARIIGDPAAYQLVPDAREDARFAAIPMVRDGAVRTYAASTLVTAHDVPIGTLCVYDADTVAVSDEALAVLEELAAAVMTVLEQRRQHEAVRTTLAELAVGTQADLRARVGEGTVVVEELPTMWGDDVQVRAVTQNLVANALKYAGAAPQVRVHAVSAAGASRLVVSDNGPGVPLTDRATIFDLHVRGDTHASTGIEGLGIGLATCRRILDAHGGRIGVEGSEDGGAAFWFELPDRPD